MALTGHGDDVWRCTHIGPSVYPDDDYQCFIDQAKKYYSGPMTLAKDLMSSERDAAIPERAIHPRLAYCSEDIIRGGALLNRPSYRA